MSTTPKHQQSSSIFKNIQSFHSLPSSALAYAKNWESYPCTLPVWWPPPSWWAPEIHQDRGSGWFERQGKSHSKMETRRSDTASNLPVKWHGFLHLLATVVSQAQRFLQFVPPGWSMSFSFISISSPLYQAPRVLFCLHPWHYCIIGLQPSDHDNGLGFASTFLEGCSGRNLEGNGGGVNWVESTILRVNWLWASRSRLSATFTCIYCLFTQNYQQKIK